MEPSSSFYIDIKADKHATYDNRWKATIFSSKDASTVGQLSASCPSHLGRWAGKVLDAIDRADGEPIISCEIVYSGENATVIIALGKSDKIPLITREFTTYEVHDPARYAGEFAESFTMRLRAIFS